MPVIPGAGSSRLASVTDLETLLKRTFSAAERASAALILDGVSGEIRTFTGQTLSLVEDDEYVVDRDRCRWNLWLPQLPVVGITSVTIDGALVPSGSYRFDAETGELRFTGAVGTWGTRTSFDPRITVVYSHGLSPVPETIIDVALEMAESRVEVPAGGIATEESIGNYSVRFDLDRAAVLNEDQRRRLLAYRVPIVG